MSHFSLEQWTNFVRGAVAEPERAQMERHLQDGCPPCDKLRGLMEEVRRSADWARENDPPEHVLRRAIRIMEPRLEPQGLGWAIAPTRLLFDSLLAPAPAGLRSAGLLQRATVHESDGITVSLRVEREAGTSVLSVVGQIAGGSGDDLSHLPVLIWRGDKTVARTLTSGAGEFHMDYAGKGPLKLVVLLERKAQRIEIPLELQ